MAVTLTDCGAGKNSSVFSDPVGAAARAQTILPIRNGQDMASGAGPELQDDRQQAHPSFRAPGPGSSTALPPIRPPLQHSQPPNLPCPRSRPWPNHPGSCRRCGCRRRTARGLRHPGRRLRCSGLTPYPTIRGRRAHKLPYAAGRARAGPRRHFRLRTAYRPGQHAQAHRRPGRGSVARVAVGGSADSARASPWPYRRRGTPGHAVPGSVGFDVLQPISVLGGVSLYCME